MLITTSPDINNLSVAFRFDISGSNPSIYITNLSTGDNLGNMLWAFVVKTPSGTFIHNGNTSSPDITGTWSNFTLSDNWPRPYNQIEWSGASYIAYVIAQDSNGEIFTGEDQSAYICRPNGNTPNSKNTFGIASSDVSVKCQEARIYFEDTTYHSYKGSDGERVASILKVVYPIDETENIPTPFQAADYTTALVPITYSSNNYQFLQNTIYDYDLGNNVTVRIKYQVFKTFSVWCNIDLMPLVCEYNKLIDDVSNGNCTDVIAAQTKINLISGKFCLVIIGIEQPLTGVDVPMLIEEIKTIGDFDCNCCSAPTGIIPQTSSIIDGYNFIINPIGGDITGTVTTNGYNITFNLQDISYVVSVCNNSPSGTSAFSFVPSTSPNQKTYCLNVDASQLAEDILNVINDDSALVNLFNSIVNNSTGNSNLLVDGKCIFQTSTSCDYIFQALNIPASGTYAILTSINGNTVNFAFNETNLSALQSYINSLSYGTFVVTNPNSGEVLLTSTGNTHNLTSITYSVSGTNYIANLTRNCAGYVPISANEVVQNIIDYLCGIDDTQVETSQAYQICYINTTSRVKETVTINGGAAVADFISELLARGCDTIDYIMSLGAVDCASLKNAFPQSIQVMQTNDYFFGTKQGDCARILPSEIGAVIFQAALTDSTLLSYLCAAVSACGGGVACQPFNYFYLTVPYSSPTDDTMDIVVNFQNSSAVSYNIRYARIDNTSSPTYISISGIVSSPYVIDNVADGRYNVGITPIYSDGRTCPEIMQMTDSCSGINSFSAVLGGSPTDSFVISYSAIAALPKVRVNIAYPNGGSSSQIYTNDGMDITIPFPTSVYGNFSISLTPVCNENTGFFGVSTAPIILVVSNPSAPAVPPAITGKTTYSSASSSGGGNITAAIGQTVILQVSASGPPAGTYSMGAYISGIGSVSATNGSNTLSFVMPSPGTIAFTGVFTYSDSYGSGVISVS